MTEQMMRQSRKIMLAFMFVLLAAGLSFAEPATPPDAAGSSNAAAEIRKLTGARTRIVWIQDAAPAVPCVFSERPTLKLMGFDSDDGKGEHEILPTIGSYAKPLITDDGKQIVFGNKVDHGIYAVNWDGTGLKAVVSGADFQDVWTDPRDGVTWIYGKLLEKRAGKDVPVMRRYRMDDSRVNELIWDKMDIYQFQVSGDGKAASGGGDGGNSMQGMLTLPNGAFHGFAGGCWPSMAPDLSHRTWVFRGHHRGIYVFLPDPLTGKASGVPCEFEGAPGVPEQGHEVYHPRWSNNIHFMTMTGPYLYSAWRWEGDVRLTSEAAAGVEIYLGKFADDFTSMAGWVQVSHNKRGDYWPDAWIEPGKGAVAAPPQQEAAPAVPQGPKPPSTEGLVFAWQDARSDNQVTDPKTQAIRLCTGEFRDLGRFARYYAMDLAGGAFVADNADAELLAACRKSGEIGIEATITPSRPDQFGAAIISFSSGGSRNFALAQVDQWLVLRLRTSSTGPDGGEVPLCTLAAGRPNHVVVSYSPGKLTCFVDGRRTLVEGRLRGNFGTWTEQHMLFGDEWNRGRNWAGTLEGVAMYSRTIGADEAATRYAACLARLEGRTRAERLVVQGKLVQASKAPAPKSIKPYRRYLSVALYDVEKVLDGKCDARRVQVAHWSIMDAKPLKSYETLAPGAGCRLVLEAFKDHPEQESERREMEDVELPLYLDVAEAPQPPTPAPRDVQWAGNGGRWDDPAGWAGGARPEFGDNAVIGEVNAGTRTITIDSPVTVGKLTMTQTAPGARNVLTLNDSLTVRGSAAPFAMSSTDPSGLVMNVNGAPLSIVNTTLDDVTLQGTVNLAGNGEVRAVAVLNGGVGYTAAPAVAFEGGGGEGAAAEATMSIASLALAKLGSGYTSAPAVAISAPDVAGGAQAAAVAKIDAANGALADVFVTDPGSGYVKAPAVTFTGGGGKGAAAEAALCVSAVCVTVPGSGYATPPIVRFTGGDGHGAVAEAALQRTLLQYTEQNGAVKLTNKGVLVQNGAAIFLDWAATVRNGAPNRNFQNAGTWTMQNGAAVRFISSTRQPIWAGNGCANSGTMKVLTGSSIGFRDFTNTGTLELGAGVTLSEPVFAESDVILSNGANGKITVSGSSAAQPAVLGAISDFTNGGRTLNNGSAAATGAELAVGSGNDASVFEIAGGNVHLENFPGCSVAIRAGATLSLRTNDNGSQHLFVSRNARFTNRGTAMLAGRIRLGGNHGGDELIANYGTFTVAGAASCERLKASAGDGAYYSADENPTRLVNNPGAVFQGDGAFTYVNSTGSDAMKAMKLVNLGTIAPGQTAPGEQGAGSIGQLKLANVNVVFGNAQAADTAGAPARPKAAASLHVEIGGPANDPSKFDSVSLIGGTLTLVEGTGNVLNVSAVKGCTPSGAYRIVSFAGGTGKFGALRDNDSDTVPYTVNYLEDGIEVVFPGAAK